MVREDGVDIFVELDVGSDYNNNDEQIRSVLYNVVREGAIASYITSVQGFQFRRLGEGKMEKMGKFSLFFFFFADTTLWGRVQAHMMTWLTSLAPSAGLAELQGGALNLSLWFLAEPLPPVEPIAVPGL